MATPPNANLSFVPWVRQGAAAAISTADTLGPAQQAVAELTAALAVNGAPVPSLTVRLRGPADVVGIDVNQIVRMDPRPGSRDFEPNYFPCIEFDRADFPWLFTPARADANGRLRPWLCLIVVRKQEGVTLGSAPDSPLATLLISAPANAGAELPDLRESWAWVHAQAAASDSSAASVGAVLGGAPQLSLSRLLCPRLLSASTDYVACVVPTFEVGRKSALGLPVTDDDLVAANALAPAWSLAPSPPAQVLLPLLHHWEFRTGVGGDFESLARKLRPQPAPPELGRRPVDVSRPGFALPAAVPPGTTLGLEGALEPIGVDDSAPPSWPAGTQAPYQSALGAIVNTPGQAAIVDPQADPILAPPLYGRWYAARAIVAPGKAAWLDQLNLDPRLRTVAAFGTRVVQENQEALMSAAWEQAAQLQQANQRVRQLQVSLAVGTRLLTRHFVPLAPDSALRLAAPALGRIRSVAGGETTSRTLVARLAATALPLRATSVAMRIMGRAQGPLTRRAATLGFSRKVTASWVGTLSLGQGSFVAPPAFDLATVSACIQSGSIAMRAYREVNDALVVAEPSRPMFQIVAEGQPVPMAFLPPFIIHVPDNPTSRNFRAAASEHLRRVNPGRLGILFGPPPALSMSNVRDTVIARMQPRVALVALARATVATGANAVAPVDTPASAAVGIDTVMAAPKFAQPMYEPLRDLSQQLLLPGIERVPPDAVLGLKTNRRFVESYMVGLNVEMASEMLWRGFPTDQRGTCFDQFWDVSTSPAPRPDIGPLHLWKDRALGDAQTAPAREQFVMLMRSDLLRRYPNAVIYATRALVTNGVRAPSADPADEAQPAFQGKLQPDISFFGFDLSTAAATGSDGSAGYYIVIQEHPTEPRFGLDDGTHVAAGATHLSLGSAPPSGLPVPSPLVWGRNSAHMAGITRQLPVRIAVHAAQFVAKQS
jgi:hypothetical protein